MPCSLNNGGVTGPPLVAGPGPVNNDIFFCPLKQTWFPLEDFKNPETQGI